MFYISLWISKIYYKFLEKNKVSDKVGLLALTIDKNFLKKISKPKIVIAVTGTNGKTTTCNMLNDILTQAGYNVVSNNEGANLKPGISKAFMKKVSIFNKCKADIAVIEFDEISSKIILPLIKPNYIIVTNLFCDTMHRNGHTDFVFNKINEGIPTYSTLLLNADDLISSQLGKNNKKIFFSINKLKDEEQDINSNVCDIRVCPNCLTKLNYTFIRYNHIGFAFCPSCGFTNHKSNYTVTSVNYDQKYIEINNDKYYLINNNITNIYNQLTTIAMLNELRIKNINTYLKNITITKSRLNTINLKNINIVLHLVKGQNATSCSRIFKEASKVKNSQVILLLDDIYDQKSKTRSEVTSWIYDTDFQFLNNDNIKKIIISGLWKYDYKLRLQLSGIKEDKISFVDNENNIKDYLDLNYNVTIIHDIYKAKLANSIAEQIKDVEQ